MIYDIKRCYENDIKLKELKSQYQKVCIQYRAVGTVVYTCALAQA